jgi:hypothetical protein
MIGDGVLDGDQVLVVHIRILRETERWLLRSSMETRRLNVFPVTGKHIGSTRLIQTSSPRITRRTTTFIFREELWESSDGRSGRHDQQRFAGLRQTPTLNFHADPPVSCEPRFVREKPCLNTCSSLMMLDAGRCHNKKFVLVC